MEFVPYQCANIIEVTLRGAPLFELDLAPFFDKLLWAKGGHGQVFPWMKIRKDRNIIA